MMQEYQAYLEPIENQQERMLSDLIDWSNHNSGSTNFKGIEGFRELIKNKAIALFGADNLIINTIAMDPFTAIDNDGNQTQMPIADGLEIRKKVKSKSYTSQANTQDNIPKKKILLLGHLDTVFSPQHHFQEAELIDSPNQSPISQYGSQFGTKGHGLATQNNDSKHSVLNGPGVADLKGGLMIMLNALAALESSPYADSIEWTMAFNPDEEIGSLSSNPWLEKLAKEHDIGLIFEPALVTGNFAGARKGSGNFSAVIRGKTAHAGRDFFDGRNAIVAMSDLILELSQLTQQKQGLTVNPAYTQGGGALNAVPDFSLIKFNIRFEIAHDEQWITEAIHDIIKKVEEKHQCAIELHGKFGRIPKEMDDAHLDLYNAFKQCGKDLGMELEWQSTGGCCDGNNLAAAGLINIDTLGAVGGNLHNDNEFIFVESLTHRAQLTALFLMKLANNDLVLHSK